MNSECNNLLTIQTAIDDYLTQTIQISSSPSDDLRADRYRNFFCVRSTSALSNFMRLSSCFARSERLWTSLPMSSATPADFIDVRASKARASHLGFERTEIVLPGVLKEKISLSVYRFAPQDHSSHVTCAVRFPSLISQKLMIYYLIQYELF